MPRCLKIPLLLLLLSLGACNEPKTEEDKVEAAIPVAVAAVSQGPIAASYKATATVVAAAETTVVAKVAGIVVDIMVEEGQAVEAGAILAQLETERLKLERDRAHARHQQLLNEYARQQDVYAKNLISRDAYERTRFERDAAAAEFALAELRLREAFIRAPIAGTVSARHIKLGNMVQLNAPLFQLTDLSRLQAVLHVPEREMAKLAPGQRAAMRADAWPQDHFSGAVERINPLVDAGSGTVKVTIALQNRERKLLPGMFGKIEVEYDHHPQALLIPKNAVLIEDALASVFVIEQGKARRRPVRLGYSNADSHEILEGLQAGDQVVTTGRASLKDGVPTQIVEPAS